MNKLLNEQDVKDVQSVCDFFGMNSFEITKIEDENSNVIFETRKSFECQKNLRKRGKY